MKSPARTQGALSRRRFLAGASASLLAAPALVAPALAQSGGSGDVDIAIVGGGAAGIAAARRIAAAGRSYVLLEASGRLGGRARTVSVFGRPVDLGASGFSRRDSTLAAAAGEAGLALAPLPVARRLYAGGQEANEGDYDAFTLALGRLRRDIVAAGDAGRDVAASSVDTAGGPWAATAAALVGPLACGRGLAGLSTLDLALRTPAADDVTSPLGVGAMLESLGAWLNVQKDAPVTLITNAGRTSTLAIRGQRGVVRARAIILAVPAATVVGGDLRFNPPLQTRVAAAFRAFPAGQIEQVAFALPGNPFQLGADEPVLARVDGATPGMLWPGMLRARLGGSDVYRLSFGDEAAREIAAKGAPEAQRRVNAWLKTAFGASAPDVAQVQSSNWSTDPLFRGAMALATPGQAALRRQFGDPLGRIFLAGDYTSVSQWGTLAGAWNSGEAAAARALSLVTGPS
ncbi:FAD-dependent oxidoreductase [Ancylobacter sp. A5.8]|uniref:flavin monoamine oxidase family protein n=1 Tax=Ancylobacter gelatini TaxID=2919920 RepID=UPI001F4E7E77|nr:FAD-dependent oxidoreductase [Ancylobacter gelatini]MCJ8145079.1 FAD-dependent oxidoreductase [Ancylobacter gelatini]